MTLVDSSSPTTSPGTPPRPQPPAEVVTSSRPGSPAGVVTSDRPGSPTGVVVSDRLAAPAGAVDAHGADAPVGVTRAPSDLEQQRTTRFERVNRLRAGVLGANDGIVSVAGLAVGVAGATADIRWLLISGLAALVAGALSMAMGEYVSVSTQRDTDHALIARTRADLAAQPRREHGLLVDALAESGIPQDVVESVADSLERHDALDAHTRFRHGVEGDAVVSPWGAAITSLVSFAIGGVIPLLAILASPELWRLPVTMLAVVLALALLGMVSARLGQAQAGRATLRTIGGGLLALLVTYGIGAALGTVIG